MVVYLYIYRIFRQELNYFFYASHTIPYIPAFFVVDYNGSVSDPHGLYADPDPAF
jgi:hypothetical protein